MNKGGWRRDYNCPIKFIPIWYFKVKSSLNPCHKPICKLCNRIINICISFMQIIASQRFMNSPEFTQCRWTQPTIMFDRARCYQSDNVMVMYGNCKFFHFVVGKDCILFYKSVLENSLWDVNKNYSSKNNNRKNRNFKRSIQDLVQLVACRETLMII